MAQFGIYHKELEVRPEILNQKLEPWAGTDEAFYQSEIEAPDQPDWMSRNLLSSEELQLQDQSNKWVAARLAGTDNNGTSSYTDIDNQVTNAVEVLDDEVQCSLHSPTERTTLDEVLTMLMLEQRTSPTLRKLVILNGLTLT